MNIFRTVESGPFANPGQPILPRGSTIEDLGELVLPPVPDESGEGRNPFAELF